MVYISERITNIAELESQIQNAKLHFEILKAELKHTTLSRNADSAVYQVEQSLKKASEFEFLLEKRIADLEENIRNQQKEINSLKYPYEDVKASFAKLSHQK